MPNTSDCSRDDELAQKAARLEQINRELTDSEERLRLAIATGRIGLWIWNSTDIANAGDWSPRLKEIFGLPAETEVTHEIFLECVHEEDRARVNDGVMQALGGIANGVYVCEYRVHRKNDDALRWVTARGQAFFNAEGQPIRFIGTLMDITERKQSEDAILGLNVELERHVVERATELAQTNKALQAEIEVRTRVEEALRRSEDYLQLAIDTIPGLVWTSLPDGHIEYLNKRWLEYTGLGLEEAIGWGWQRAVHPEDLPGLVEYWKAIIESGEAGEYEARLRRHDGEFRWFLFRGVPLKEESGAIVKWYGTNTDVEARRASEHVTLGQLEALTHLLGALSQEGDPERLLEHVARMIRDQMRSHSVTFWAMNDADVLDRLATFENERLQFPAEAASAAQVVALRALGHPVWDEFFASGDDCVEGDFTGDPPLVRIANREDSAWLPAWGHPHVDPAVQAAVRRVMELGVATTLTVPMVISGRVEGIISARFMERKRFRTEELELVKALAHQAMLTVHMMRLSRQSRQAAIVSERNRLARDIHDTLAQGFTGVIVQLEAAEDARSRGLDAESDAHLARARELAGDSLREARRSVQALRPKALTGQDLCAALSEMICKMTTGTALKGEFAVEGEPAPLSSVWEDHLLHIGQELLTNSVRHARATHFKGQLAFASHTLRMEFSDNGRGFDPQQKADGLGLLGMKERVAAMNGELTIRSAPGEGCSVIVVLPLPVSNPDPHAAL